MALTQAEFDRIMGKQTAMDRAVQANQPTISAQRRSFFDAINNKAQAQLENLGMNRSGARDLTQKLLGSDNQIGIADFTPLAIPKGIEYAGREFLAPAMQDLSRGNIANAIGGAGLSLGAVALATGRVPAPIKNVASAGVRAIAGQIQDGRGVFGNFTIDPKMYALPPQKYQGRTLEGMPTNIKMDTGKIEQFGTDQRLVDLAKQYTADRGIPYVEQNIYASVDPVRGKKIADAYEKMLNNPADPKVKKAYDALIKETQEQYEALKKAGMTFDFIPKGTDPYGNPRNAINDIILNKNLSIYPTTDGFGSLTTASQTNPLLQKTGEKWDGKDVLVNDMFRAVHDVFGHAKRGVGFRAAGEENAFQSHARMFSKDALPALASETRGQNSWVNFGPFGKQNQLATPENTIYADQKIGILPEFAYLEGLLR